jgi:hypothetical protein
MPESANVKSLDSLIDFRVALINFIEKSKLALSTGEAEISNMQSWVGHRQLMHWKIAIRKSEEKLSQAKSELFRATISQPDNPRGPTDQIRLVNKRKEEIANAQKKYERTKRWGRILEHENHEYRSAITPLATSLEGELQKAVMKIDNAIVAIELYLADVVAENEELNTETEATSIARRGVDRKDAKDEHGNGESTIDEGNEETPP